MEFGQLRHRVTLDNPSAPIADTDGGQTYLWPPDGGIRLGARVPASVAPDTERNLERRVAKTVEGIGTYLVRLRYLAGVTLETRVIFHDGPTDRTLWVNGIHDDGRHAVLALSCAERVA
jgi:head-tail adaptor